MHGAVGVMSGKAGELQNWYVLIPRSICESKAADKGVTRVHACMQESVSIGSFGRSKYRVRAKIVSRTSWNYWYVVCLPSVSIGLLIVTSLKV